jgi:hypothetical protein
MNHNSFTILKIVIQYLFKESLYFWKENDRCQEVLDISTCPEVRLSA